MTAVETDCDKLLTIEEFAALEDRETLYELVRGRLVKFSNVGFAQAVTTMNIVGALAKFEFGELGAVTCGGVGVITGRNPDTVREAKIAYYSHARSSKLFREDDVWESIPDLVIENPRPQEAWSTVIGRVADLLSAGVNVVAVVDFPARAVQVFRSNRPPLTLTANDQLNLGRMLPESMPGCVIQTSEFFED